MKIIEPNVKEHLIAYLKILPTYNDGIMTSILNMFRHSTLHHKIKEFYDLTINLKPQLYCNQENYK